MTPDRLARLRLARSEGVGPITYRRLLARFPSPEEALAALPDLARSAGRAGPLRIATLRDAEREAEALRRRGATLLFQGDPLYPQPLAWLPDAPPLIAVLGDPAALTDRAVGIVGARNASAPGQRMAEALGADLASRGLVVVSGLARGIDAAAHRGALHTGRTVACIAGGLDMPYPPEHADLQARIAERGAVVSEAPLGTAPQARHFPKRNRVIAGLSLGVVVVEAAMRSGSLITARFAQEAGREIFAVPGSPLDPRALGSNDLLRQGAILTESADDVLANLPKVAAPPTESGALAEARVDYDVGAAVAAVASLLSPSPGLLDDLIRRSGQPAGAVMAALTQLELAGKIEMLPGSRVCSLPE